MSEDAEDAWKIQPFFYLKKRGKKSRRKAWNDRRWMRHCAVINEGITTFLEFKEKRKEKVEGCSKRCLCRRRDGAAVGEYTVPLWAKRWCCFGRVVYEMAVTFREDNKLINKAWSCMGRRWFVFVALLFCCFEIFASFWMSTPESCRVETKMCSWRVVYEM